MPVVRLGALTLAVALATVGCGGGMSADRVAALISKQAARQVKQAVGGSGKLRTVECVSAGDGRFDCVARVRVDGRTVPVQVAATCDGDRCVWRPR